MAAGKYDILVEQGATFSLLMTLQTGAVPPVPIPLTGWTFQGEIRATPTSPTIIANFVCTLADQVANPGQVTISLSATVTAGITPPVDDPCPADDADNGLGGMVYDVLGNDGSGNVYRVIEGNVNFSLGVTR
jgi:hypothetical protein